MNLVLVYLSVGLGGGMATLLVENDIFSYLVLSGSFSVCYSLLWKPIITQILNISLWLEVLEIKGDENSFLHFRYEG